MSLESMLSDGAQRMGDLLVDIIDGIGKGITGGATLALGLVTGGGREGGASLASSGKDPYDGQYTPDSTPTVLAQRGLGNSVVLAQAQNLSPQVMDLVNRDRDNMSLSFDPREASETMLGVMPRQFNEYSKGISVEQGLGTPT